MDVVLVLDTAAISHGRSSLMYGHVKKTSNSGIEGDVVGIIAPKGDADNEGEHKEKETEKKETPIREEGKKRISLGGAKPVSSSSSASGFSGVGGASPSSSSSSFSALPSSASSSSPSVNGRESYQGELVRFLHHMEVETYHMPLEVLCNSVGASLSTRLQS